MRIERIEIENIRGIKELSFAPQTITHIRGRNGTGKSSVIAAIRAVFDGGKDPSLLRVGTKRGGVKILLSNGWTFDKRITPSAATLTVKDENGDTIPAPQETVNRIASAMAVDPSKILSMDTTTARGKKDFCELLLSLIPISFSEGEMLEALNGCDVRMPDGKRDLDYIDRLRKTVYERRTRANLAQQEADKAADAIKAMLPKDAGEVVDVAARDAELSTESERLEAESIAKQRAVSESYDRQIQQLRVKSETERMGIAKTYAPLLADVRSERDGLRESAKLAAVAAESKRMYDVLCDRYAVEGKKYTQANAALESIDKLRKSRLESLPVEGLDVTDNNPTLAGVPWQVVNTARRCEVAVQLAAMLASNDLAFMVLDDAEHLDDETRSGIESAATSAGYQVVSAMVDSAQPALKVEAA